MEKLHDPSEMTEVFNGKFLAKWGIKPYEDKYV